MAFELIRNEETYPATQKWFAENMRMLGNGTPEGFIEISDLLQLRGNKKVQDENDNLGKAVQKVVAAYKNVEFNSKSGRFVVKSADMLHAESLQELSKALVKQADDIAIVLEFQNFVRESVVKSLGTGWLITEVDEKKAKSFGSASKAKHQFYVSGVTGEGQSPYEVAPVSLDRGLSRPVNIYIEALDAVAPGLLVPGVDSGFADKGIAVKGRRVDIGKVRAFKFQNLEAKVTVAKELLKTK